MNIFSKLFSATEKAVNEDEGYTDHLVGQKKGPYYCGTAFCGHHTKAAARKCWKDKCDAVDRICSEVKALRASGKMQEADAMLQAKTAQYYPERNPANWPCNRSSREMQQEYIEKAHQETEVIK